MLRETRMSWSTSFLEPRVLRHVRWGAPVAVGVAALAAFGTHAFESHAADHNDPVGVQATYQSGTSSSYEVSTGDPAADIADIFAWYSPDKARAIFALTWRADPTEARERSFDPSVKYTIHVDDSGQSKPLEITAGPAGLSVGSRLDTPAHKEMVFWFGESKREKGAWGMMASGLPGVSGDFVGAVGKTHEPARGVKVAAGLFDDAFFADLDGFFNSISVALPPLVDPRRNPSLPQDRFSAKDPATQRLALPFGYPVDRVDGFGKQNVHAVVVEVPVASFRSHKLHVWATSDRVRGPKSGADLKCSYDGKGGTYACGDKAQGGSR